MSCSSEASKEQPSSHYRIAALAMVLAALALVVPGALLSLTTASAPVEPMSETHTPVAYLPLIAGSDRPITTATPTEIHSTATATLAEGHLPDLIITGMVIALETGGACDYPSTQLGLRVWFENIGDTPAGPFVVEANSAQQSVDGGLDIGAAGDVWFPGYVYSEENSAVVDATSLVAESREDNNRRSQSVPIPTLPPTCTPTLGTPTQTPTSILTPTPTSILDQPQLRERVNGQRYIDLYDDRAPAFVVRNVVLS